MSPDDNRTPTPPEEIVQPEREERERLEAEIQRREKKRSERRDLLLKSVSLVASISVALGTVLLKVGSQKESRLAERAIQDAEAGADMVRKQREETLRMERQRDAATERLAQVQNENASLRAELEKVKSNGGRPISYAELNPADRELVQSTKSDEAKLDVRLGKLEDALGNTPEKALSGVMIKQRLDDLQDRTHGDIDSIHGEIGRLFTLTQWFIGLIFTIALGVSGLAFANLKKPKQ